MLYASTLPVADEGQKHCCAGDHLLQSLAAFIPLKEEELLIDWKMD